MKRRGFLAGILAAAAAPAIARAGSLMPIYVPKLVVPAAFADFPAGDFTFECWVKAPQRYQLANPASAAFLLGKLDEIRITSGYARPTREPARDAWVLLTATQSGGQLRTYADAAEVAPSAWVELPGSGILLDTARKVIANREAA